MATHTQASSRISLPQAAHQLAEQFSQRQFDRFKAEQVYLNTLAVYAVNEYLQRHGFETEWNTSDSWDAVMQALLDVGDLRVKPYGKLECRPVLPDTADVFIPFEVWHDRMAFVAVQLDDALEIATLLGFIRDVSSETVNLAQFHPLGQLLDELKQRSRVEVNSTPIRLSQWLRQVIDAGWQVVESGFSLADHQQPAYSFRDTQLTALSPDSKPIVECQKILNLTTRATDAQIALLIGLHPSTTETIEIWAEVKPLDEQSHLPPSLQLIVLDADGTEIMHAQARNTEIIQFQFGSEVGEQFSLKVILDDISVTEAFVV